LTFLKYTEVYYFNQKNNFNIIMKINKSIYIAFFSIIFANFAFAQTNGKTTLTETYVDEIVEKSVKTTTSTQELEQTSKIQTTTADGTYIEGEMEVEREIEKDGDMDEKVTIEYEGEKQDGTEIEGTVEMKTKVDSNDKVKREVMIKEEVENESGKEVETVMETKTVIKDNGKMKTKTETKTETETAAGDDYKTISKSKKEIDVDEETTKKMMRQKN